MTETPLWRPDPDAADASQMRQFMRLVENRHSVTLEDYADLHRWSVERGEDFWTLVWDFCGVIAETRGDRIVQDKDKLPGAAWFPDARLNFAENLLRGDGDGDAIVFWGEDQVKRRLSHGDLHAQVSRLQQALRDLSVGPGDRIAGFLPNLPETVIAMLAATSLGAIWSSCSPDFGVQGVMDRFGQIAPKVLFVADGYFYNGKAFDSLEKAREIVPQLPSLTAVLAVPYIEAGTLDGIAGARWWNDVIAGYEAKAIDYTPMGFNDPLYIMYSSGTTGQPKCIVHGVGGTLIQHLKEHRLHCDMKPGDKFFYFTTCGWMMWNWLVSGLASGATLLLFDGSPFHPSGNVLFDFAEAEGMTHFGTSAKWLDAAAKAGIAPAESHDLTTVRMLLSTGSPLAPQGFDYVYDKIGTGIQLASIAGGTDIISCFMGGNPLDPVWRGEIQGPLTGMDVQVFDADGRAVADGEQGELVCVNSFPCMPIGFWNDADGAKYHAAYFDVYDNVWRHGDWIERTAHGGYVIYGRSDATLNPGGVRIGTAEIYRQVEQLDEVLEGLVIGQQWDNDVRIVLFVRLRDDVALDDDLTARIKRKIRSGASPRHVPAKIIHVPDIPRTINGKITELAVADTVHDRPVKNQSALLNPECLDLFVDMPELRD